MKTLRAKFALLLVVSIVSVVVLITLGVMYVVTTPANILIDMRAKQMILMDDLAKQNPDATALADRADTGAPDEDQTELLRSATARLGTPLDVYVTYGTGDTLLRTASLPVGPDKWLVVNSEPVADPQLWSWLLLITVSVGSIAVFAANRMSRPLALLESAVESVGPDGTIPTLAEQGPTEVHATAAAINALSARLKRAVGSRMRLVAAAGHDFRTPLTRMILRAEFVSDDDERACSLSDIDELGRIADSAIELVREEAMRTSPEVIQLDDLVRAIVSELKEHDFRIQIAETATVFIRASRLGLSRALRNLLINAATHGVSGVVSVAGGSIARIIIVDQGPGIDPKILG